MLHARLSIRWNRQTDRIREGFEGNRVIAFVEFLVFIGLMKWKQVEGAIPTSLSNTINPKNTMNLTMFKGSEGDTRVGGKLKAGSEGHLTVFNLNC